MTADLDRLCANTIRGLAMDAVQAADSGHPGMPMGMADVATVLWTRFLKFDPADPKWPDRDRFVLSAGHGSMLLYSLLHLSGFDLPLSELRRFRQLGSRTPGHPEYGHTVGVETTTGPLGQGFANAVGMAIAERMLRETFGAELCDHFVYAICSDGDVQEGISHESAALAGHLGLGRLIYLYDDNHITIDGPAQLSMSDDVCERMESYGWHTERVDGFDREAVAAAITRAKADPRPSLIACRTIIGFGSPSYEGTSRTHGAALGADEVKKAKAKLGLDPEKSFVVPPEVAAAFHHAAKPEERAAWERRVADHPRGKELREWLAADGAALASRVSWPEFPAGKAQATRKTSQACLKAIVKAAPWVIGGSADLAGSNGTEVDRAPLTREKFAGAGTINFGIREHGMGAICNGMSLHGGIHPYGATFLIFHDYMRPSVRLSCLMGVPVTWIYTHDSIFLGEDGPTHQPIETLLALRAIPGMRVFRPADGAETIEAWRAALQRKDGPTSLILTRQNLPEWDHSRPGAGAAEIRRGGYILAESEGGAPQVVLIGTGSEVQLCGEARKLLAARGIRARVVSAPCRELLWEQDREWRDHVLPPGVPRLAVEAAATLGWERYVGDAGGVVGIDRFGASAPMADLAEFFGFTPANVASAAERVLAG